MLYVPSDELQGQSSRQDGVPPRPQPPSDIQDVQGDYHRQHGHPPVPVPMILAVPLRVLRLSFGVIGKVLGISGHLVRSIAEKILPRRVMRFLRSVSRALLGGPQQMDPTTSAVDFIRRFTAKHGERCPRWQISGWEAAASRAQSEGLFLFVYLQSSMHQDTESFCADTLCAPAFVDYLNSTFLAWGGDIRYSDAFKLASSLRVCSYPYCGLLAFSGSRTRLITSVEGPIRPEALAELLQTALVEHGGLLWEERIVQEQRENDRRLREEQDAEYQQSLEADRARELERKRAEEVERQKQYEKEEAERLERERIEAERMEQERIALALEKRRESKKAILEEEPIDEAEVAVIRVRFPSGETHQRKFSRQSSLQKVFDWVESLDCNVFQNFSLSTTYPRRILSEEQAMRSLEELEFSRQTALAVQPEE